MNGLLIIFDLIWLLTVGGVWTTYIKGNDLWNGLHPLHDFVIFISVLSLILKVNKFE
jgi:hypothetical protein